MINPTKEIRMTASLYLPQLVWDTYKYCDYDIYTTTGSFEEMFVNKYYGKVYQFSIHSFKVKVIQ